MSDKESNFVYAIRNLLLSIVTEEERNETYTDLVVYVTSGDLLLIWNEAFTSPLMSDSNYERLEFRGDLVVGDIVGDILFTNYPDMDPEELTGMKTHYVSNEVQGHLLKKYHPELIEFLLHDPSLLVTEEMIADLYEALVGAMHMAGNQALPGSGYMWSQRWVRGLYLREGLDRKWAKGDAVNELEKIFSRFDYKYNLPKPSYKTEGPLKIKTPSGREEQRMYVKVRLPEKTVAFLKDPQIRQYLPEKAKLNIDELNANVVLGSGEDKVKPKAKLIASENALKELKDRFGINSEWASDAKTKIDLEFMDEQLRVRLKAKLAKQGYKSISVRKQHKMEIDGNRTVLKLYGLREINGSIDTKGELITSYVGDGNAFNTKVGLINKYVSMK